MLNRLENQSAIISLSENPTYYLTFHAVNIGIDIFTFCLEIILLQHLKLLQSSTGSFKCYIVEFIQVLHVCRYVTYNI